MSMIDRKIFAVGMGVLAERFRTEIAGPAQKGYHTILSEELNDEEFQIAVKLAFRHSQFWPSPQQLIDFVRPPANHAVNAGIAFERLLDAGEILVQGRPKCWRREVVHRMGKAVLVGFDAIGGNDRLREYEARELPFIRRDFVEAYKATFAESEAELQIAAARTAIGSMRQRSLRSTPELIGDIARASEP